MLQGPDVLDLQLRIDDWNVALKKEKKEKQLHMCEIKKPYSVKSKDA